MISKDKVTAFFYIIYAFNKNLNEEIAKDCFCLPATVEESVVGKREGHLSESKRYHSFLSLLGYIPFFRMVNCYFYSNNFFPIWIPVQIIS